MLENIEEHHRWRNSKDILKHENTNKENNTSVDAVFKGVLLPRPVFGLFLQFSQKLQHIGNKWDMFLIGNISGNLITAL